jgi:hypothetical protein
MGVDELVAAEAGGTLEPSELEVEIWYQENRGRLGGRSLDELRSQIADHLRDERLREATSQLEARLFEEREVVIHFEPARVVLNNEGAPVSGSPGRTRHPGGVLGLRVPLLRPTGPDAEAPERDLRRRPPHRLPPVPHPQPPSRGLQGGGSLPVCPRAGQVLGDARPDVCRDEPAFGGGPEGKGPEDRAWTAAGSTSCLDSGRYASRCRTTCRKALASASTAPLPSSSTACGWRAARWPSRRWLPQHPEGVGPGPGQGVIRPAWKGLVPDMPPQGCGEPAITLMGGLLANAVQDAVGARAYTLPMTPERVLTALGGPPRPGPIIPGRVGPRPEPGRVFGLGRPMKPGVVVRRRHNGEPTQLSLRRVLPASPLEPVIDPRSSPSPIALPNNHLHHTIPSSLSVWSPFHRAAGGCFKSRHISCITVSLDCPNTKTVFLDNKDFP